MEITVNSLGAPIAQGRTAEIYAWGEGQVVKLFRDWVPAGQAAFEAQVAQAAQATGVPMPAVGEIVEVDGRFGLVYERVDGPTMDETLQRKPWKLGWIAKAQSSPWAAV